MGEKEKSNKNTFVNHWTYRCKEVTTTPHTKRNSHWNFFLFLVRWHWRCISYGRKRFYIFVYFRALYSLLLSNPLYLSIHILILAFFIYASTQKKNVEIKFCDISNTNYINLNLFCSLNPQQNFVYFIRFIQFLRYIISKARKEW